MQFFSADNQKKISFLFMKKQPQKCLIIHIWFFFLVLAWLPKRPIFGKNKNLKDSPCLLSIYSLLYSENKIQVLDKIYNKVILAQMASKDFFLPHDAVATWRKAAWCILFPLFFVARQYAWANILLLATRWYCKTFNITHQVLLISELGMGQAKILELKNWKHNMASKTFSSFRPFIGNLTCTCTCDFTINIK